MSVIKRLFGKDLMSRLTRLQNRELSFKCITYNMHRLINFVILMMFSTKPDKSSINNVLYILLWKSMFFHKSISIPKDTETLRI